MKKYFEKSLLLSNIYAIFAESFYYKGIQKIIIMSPTHEISRNDYIRLKLKRGDVKRIADQLGIYPEWVSRVIRGHGVSEPILRAAEALIAERENEERLSREQEKGKNAKPVRKREKMPVF